MPKFENHWSELQIIFLVSSTKCLEEEDCWSTPHGRNVSRAYVSRAYPMAGTEYVSFTSHSSFYDLLCTLPTDEDVAGVGIGRSRSRAMERGSQDLESKDKLTQGHTPATGLWSAAGNPRDRIIGFGYHKIDLLFVSSKGSP